MPEELRDLGDEEFVKGCRTLGGSVRFLEPTGEPSRALLPEALRRLEASIEEIKRLQKRVDCLLSSVKSDAFCPCCQETEVCDPECTLATDCPDDWERMVLARGLLEEEKGDKS